MRSTGSTRPTNRMSAPPSARPRASSATTLGSGCRRARALTQHRHDGGTTATGRPQRAHPGRTPGQAEEGLGRQCGQLLVRPGRPRHQFGLPAGEGLGAWSLWRSRMSGIRARPNTPPRPMTSWPGRGPRRRPRRVRGTPYEKASPARSSWTVSAKISEGRPDLRSVSRSSKVWVPTSSFSKLAMNWWTATSSPAVTVIERSACLLLPAPQTCPEPQ